jgi:hypothetical protein
MVNQVDSFLEGLQQELLDDDEVSFVKNEENTPKI